MLLIDDRTGELDGLGSFEEWHRRKVGVGGDQLQRRLGCTGNVGDRCELLGNHGSELGVRSVTASEPAVVITPFQAQGRREQRTWILTIHQFQSRPGLPPVWLVSRRRWITSRLYREVCST